MIIQEADHPLVVFCELVVTLPEVVAVLTLKSALTPDSSGLGDWIVQSSLVEEFVDGCVAGYALLVVVTQVAFYAA